MADDARDTDEEAESEAVKAAREEKLIVDENWQRYEYLRGRGHTHFCQEVRRLEDYYLGGGRQWSEADKETLKLQNRMPIEINEVKPAVNAALGYQISNRMDISYRPRGELATQEIANILNKVTMQVADNQHLHWKETDVFADGLIQRRGFFDAYIGFDDSMRGEIRIDVLDPMDVLMDADAKSYSPDSWADVIITRWLTLDEIEQRYGKDARDKAEAFVDAGTAETESDHGEHEGEGENRNKFGDSNSGRYGVYDAIRRDKHMTRLRIVDRQKFVYKMAQVIVYPKTGDVRVVEDMEPDRVAELLATGGILSRRMAKRVRWVVSTYDALLHNDWSPYPFFTVVPYFAYFRRGKTSSMVDDAVGPQDALNKAVSQFIHIINSTANSGWIIEQNSLTNMETDDLEENGATTGVVLEHKKGTNEPKKIQPTQLPAGIDRMIDRLMVAIKENTVPDAARGIDDDSLSGVARQSKQFAAQQQLAVPLDNLGRTRNILASRLIWFIQNFYDDERIFRITKENPQTGQPEDEVLRVNALDETTGQILNDLTLGEYDTVITETPMQVTFENGQFDQAMKMREAGVQIPDDVVIRSSNLAGKADLLQRMAQQQEKPDPKTDADIQLKAAQARKANADATARGIETLFSATQAGNLIAQNPAIAPIADGMLKSVGFQDQDAAPIVPTPAAGTPSLTLPENTNPNTPLNPVQADVGVTAGIEAGI